MALATRPLGSSGLHITTVGFGYWAVGGGGWSFGWGPQDDSDSFGRLDSSSIAGTYSRGSRRDCRRTGTYECRCRPNSPEGREACHKGAFRIAAGPESPPVGECAGIVR
jgi:hypothetical protein